MNHAKRRRSLEPVPVSRLGNPLHIILNEGVISRISVHHAVHPDARRVQHRVLGRQRLLNLIDQEHISVVVLLQEHQRKVVPHTALQNLDHALLTLGLVLLQGFRRLDELDHGLCEDLLLFVDEVERDLVCF
jgi:hypothetical protein